MIHDVLATAVAMGASDILLTVGIPPYVRLHEELVPMAQYPVLTPGDTKRFVDILMSGRCFEKLTTSAGNLDFSYAKEGLARFRVNAFLQRGSSALVIRVVPHVVPSLGQLRLPSQLKDIASLSRGLVLISGSTGSGKSTTLAALVNEINENRCLHVITLERPIEYLHRHKCSIINQREVGSDVKSFVEGLRSCEREDADVVVVGEFKDNEVIRYSIELVELGHLVFAECDAVSTVQALERIVEGFPVEQQDSICMRIATALEAAVSQYLVMRKNEDGQVAVLEVFIATEAARTLMAGRKMSQLASLIESGAKHGMQSYRMALDDLYRRGLIGYEQLESGRALLGKGNTRR
jgi:twitching motility protein PilT